MRKIKILNLDNYEGTIKVINQNRNLIPLEFNVANSEVEVIICRLGSILSNHYLKNFQNLKYIATITTGVDHIDHQYCQKKNIKIVSLRGHNKFLKSIRSTPELTWGLIIMLYRHLYEAVDFVKKGSGWRNNNFFGNELNGKIIGIVGYGRIGRQLAKYAVAFGMRVLVNDVKEIITDGKKIKNSSKKEICTKADVIVIAANANNESKAIINKSDIKAMNKNTVVINASRGSLLDEYALLQALKNSKIKGAALDVLAGEIKPSELMKCDLLNYAKKNNNLIITPHLGGSTFEAMDLTAKYLINELIKTIKLDDKNN